MDWRGVQTLEVCRDERVEYARYVRAYSVTELSLIKSWFDEGQFGVQGTTQRD